MTSKNKIALIVAVALLTSCVAPSAGATPVVDQYTEQVPSPGGPVPMQPGQPSIPTNSGSGSSAGTAGAGAGEGGFTTASAEDGIGGSNGSSGGDGTSTTNENSASGPGNGSEQSGSGSQSVDGMFASTGESDGNGMGWLFPAALVLVAGTVVGFAFGRRGRGPATT